MGVTTRAAVSAAGQPPKKSAEELIQSLAHNVSTMDGNFQLFQQQTESSINSLEKHMSQLVDAVGRLEAKDSGKLPFRTEPNPKPSVCAAYVRRKKKVEESGHVEPEMKVEKRVEPELEVEKKVEEKIPEEKYISPVFPVYEPVPPFPYALRESRKSEPDKAIFDTFKRLEVIRSRLQEQGQVRNSATHYDGVIDCIKKVFRKEGLSGFYRGCATNLLRTTPSAVITFTSYEMINRYMRRVLPPDESHSKSHPKSDGHIKPQKRIEGTGDNKLRGSETLSNSRTTIPLDPDRLKARH